MGDKLGMRMIPMQSVSFHSVVVTGQDLVGQEGKGVFLPQRVSQHSQS